MDYIAFGCSQLLRDSPEYQLVSENIFARDILNKKHISKLHFISTFLLFQQLIAEPNTIFGVRRQHSGSGLAQTGHVEDEVSARHHLIIAYIPVLIIEICLVPINTIRP